ncbi:hypothetical protein ACFL13_02490 [Patescibacteria group bacterium]
MKSTAYYIKSSILSALLFFESLIVTKLALKFTSTHNYFVPSKELLISFGLAFLALLLTNALMVGTWGKWQQFVFVSLSIALGVFVSIYTTNPTYAVILSAGIFLFVSFDLILASQLKKQFIKFKPRLVLRITSKGILFSYSLITAALVIVVSGKEPKIDVGEKAGEFASKYFTNLLNKKVSEQVNEQTQDNLATFGLDPVEVTKFNSNPLIQNIGIPEIDLRETIRNEINKVVEPYKRLVNPIMSVVAFGVVQLIGLITYPIYALLVEPMLSLAKKLGLLRVSTVTVEKEELHF